MPSCTVWRAGSHCTRRRWRAAGYEVLAEDQTWWQAQSGLVTGLDRFLRAYPESLARFAPSELLPASSDQRGKLLLPLAAGGNAPLVAVGFLGLTGGKAAALRALWECSGVPLLPASRERVSRSVEQLLAGVKLFGLSRDEVLPRAAALLG